MKPPKIKSIKILPNYRLIILFSNSDKRLYDVKKLFDIEIFQPLKNPALFKNAQIEKGGYAVSWNKEIDISEYELWKNGIPQ
ncbi:MAG: DUF2442 domain-containing protein [Candidatus Zixiibacteriota bacterium]